MPWATEQVNVDDLHGNAVFYLVNPLEVKKPFFAAPHYVGCIEDVPDVEPNDVAWILYTSEADRRTYVTWRYRRATPRRIREARPGDTVWILYSSEADRRSYFKQKAPAL